MAEDPHGLQRFVDAQAGVLAQVEAELSAGRKSSHWMWFVFPQWRGLGTSAMAMRYAIGSRDEGLAYLAHPLLGARLRAWTALVLRHRGTSARQIFGSPDDLKFRSSMTLFAALAPGEPLFAEALAAFYRGEADPRTLAALRVA